MAYYRHQLARSDNTTVITLTPNYNADNKLKRDLKEVNRFRKLCQGKKLHKPTRNMHCELKTYGQAHLLLKPVRVEYLHEGEQRLQASRHTPAAATRPILTPLRCGTGIPPIRLAKRV